MQWPRGSGGARSTAPPMARCRSWPRHWDPGVGADGPERAEDARALGVLGPEGEVSGDDSGRGGGDPRLDRRIVRRDLDQARTAYVEQQPPRLLAARQQPTARRQE